MDLRVRRIVVAALVLGATAVPTVPAASAPPASETSAVADACAGAGEVASTRLRTRKGTVLGTAQLAYGLRQGDRATVCGFVEVPPRFHRDTTLVTRTLVEKGADGQNVGRVVKVQRATRLTAVRRSSSFVPSGHTFVLRVQIDAGRRSAQARLRYLVP